MAKAATEDQGRVDQALDLIGRMTILELRDLNKRIQDEFGITAAPVAVAAAPAAPSRAIGCLVNWARGRDRRRPLTPRPALQRAAAIKGKEVASCGQFSHTPCGTDVTSAVRAAGYRYATFGENLFVGSWGQVTARDVLTAWLQSPLHRANVLRPSFRDLGAAPARAPGLLGTGDTVVWTATFASPR